ncbi:MAG: TetR/AcrR family transcriptional regulator [Myxococcota bacterium]
MGRPREHDPQQVIEDLLVAFSRTGYAHTSFSDLEAATGLDRAQLSRSYGSKRDLFILALERRLQIGWDNGLKALGESGTLDDIRRFLLQVSSLYGTEAGELGCLVCNTSHEAIVSQDREVQALVRKHFKRVETALEGALRNSVAAGEIQLDNAGARRAARLLYGVHVSLLVLLRAGEKRAVLKDIANGAVDGLL